MSKAKTNAVIQKIAREHGVTPEHVYRSIQESIDEARKNPDPRSQALWSKIPHKGETVTVEEFLEYMSAFLIT